MFLYETLWGYASFHTAHINPEENHFTYGNIFSWNLRDKFVPITANFPLSTKSILYRCKSFHNFIRNRGDNLGGYEKVRKQPKISFSPALHRPLIVVNPTTKRIAELKHSAYHCCARQLYSLLYCAINPYFISSDI